MPRTVALIILDGWGIGAKNESNPIYSAHPATFEFLEKNYPTGSLQASGITVGLPWNEVGNSEVGHLTLGAGKILYQYYPKISLAIRDGSFFKNPALQGAFAHAKKTGGRVNLVGLLTSATTHAALDHLHALIKMGADENVPVNLHLFADAIDGPPRTLESLLAKIPMDRLGTLIGRYYAMDRSENWQLVRQAYECITEGTGETPPDFHLYLEALYAKRSEEFLPPLVFDKEKCVRDGDAVIFFNYREDGIRELAEAFLAPDFDKFPRPDFKNVFIATMSQYEERFTALVAFPADRVIMPLGKVLADAGKNQLRVAETYKYAHVTYFFNGHAEEPFKNEYRVMIPSLTSPRADEHPELMASAVTDRVIEAIQGKSFDFVLANYSNPDTIAHTGNYDACLEAVKVIDREVARLLEAAKEANAVLIITSDHGNMEEVLNPQTGRIETQHDANPVPVYLVGDEFKGRKFANWRELRAQTTGILSDVAPTVLNLMGLEVPEEMNGRSLLRDLI